MHIFIHEKILPHVMGFFGFGEFLLVALCSFFPTATFRTLQAVERQRVLNTHTYIYILKSISAIPSQLHGMLEALNPQSPQHRSSAPTDLFPFILIKPPTVFLLTLISLSNLAGPQVP